MVLVVVLDGTIAVCFGIGGGYDAPGGFVASEGGDLYFGGSFGSRFSFDHSHFLLRRSLNLKNLGSLLSSSDRLPQPSRVCAFFIFHPSPEWLHRRAVASACMTTSCHLLTMLGKELRGISCFGFGPLSTDLEKSDKMYLGFLPSCDMHSNHYHISFGPSGYPTLPVSPPHYRVLPQH